MADNIRSEWTDMKSAVMSPKTLEGPNNIVTTPAGQGIYVRWDPKSGVDYFAVVIYNMLGDDYIQKIGTRGTTMQIDDVDYNGLYTVGVESWSSWGGGMVTVGRNVRPGIGRPGTPTNLRLKKIDDTTVQLDWTGHSSAAGYRVWVRNKTSNGKWQSEQYGTAIDTTHSIWFLYPGVWNFEFQVSSYNGDLESAKSEIKSLPK